MEFLVRAAHEEPQNGSARPAQKHRPRIIHRRSGGTFRLKQTVAEPAPFDDTKVYRDLCLRRTVPIRRADVHWSLLMAVVYTRRGHRRRAVDS
jgi:hypothetical protein